MLVASEKVQKQKKKVTITSSVDNSMQPDNERRGKVQPVKHAEAHVHTRTHATRKKVVAVRRFKSRQPVAITNKH